MTHTVVGFFESLGAADLVVTELTELGLGDEHIVLVAEVDFDGSQYAHLRTFGPLGETFGSKGMSDAEAEIFAQGISQGGVVIMVTAQEEQVNAISRVMINHGAVDLERTQPEPQPGVAARKSKSAAARSEPAALPFDPDKKPLRERMGGVKTYVHVE
jgi:hypothetical protein